MRYQLCELATVGNLRLLAREERDLDALLTPDTDPERLPFWSVLWPSGVALAKHLVQTRHWDGTDVLELGCGTGVVGLSLAAAGARVTLTDLFPEAAALARHNARQNELPPLRITVADWNAWPFRRRWPVIVGSDLTYERHSHGPLLDVLARALAPGGVVYLADPGRPMTADFIPAAALRGWTLQEERLPGGIRLYRFHRTGNERAGHPTGTVPQHRRNFSPGG